MNYKKILIAADESKYSKWAVQQGLQLAEDLNAEVSIIYILSPTESIGNIDSVILPVEPGQNEIDRGKDLLNEYEQENPGSIKPVKVVKIGDPSNEILKYAEEWRADIIVIGGHGLESFKHLIFGGVVDYVATHTKIPVLLVPTLE
jgi:nucleotide-binding universal stress UspA family protein